MRDTLAKVRLREGQPSTDEMLLKTYNTAMSTAAAELLEWWAAGRAAPVPDGHLEVAKAVDASGTVVGFNVYLVWAEPRVLGGKMREEQA